MRVIDLFAGCGGMSLGFENAGFDIVAAFDNWDAAITIYEINFSHPIYKKDLGADDVVQQISALHPDLIMGGPPLPRLFYSGKTRVGGSVRTLQFGLLKL